MKKSVLRHLLNLLFYVTALHSTNYIGRFYVILFNFSIAFHLSPSTGTRLSCLIHHIERLLIFCQTYVIG